MKRMRRSVLGWRHVYRGPSLLRSGGGGSHGAMGGCCLGRIRSLAENVDQVPAPPALNSCEPFSRYSLVVGGEEVDKVGTIQEHVRFLLGLDREAYLLWWSDLLSLLAMCWRVDVEISQVAYIACFLTPSLCNCHLSVRSQCNASLIPCSWSLGMIHVNPSFARLLLWHVLGIKLLLFRIRLYRKDDQGVLCIAVPRIHHVPHMFITPKWAL